MWLIIRGALESPTRGPRRFQIGGVIVVRLRLGGPCVYGIGIHVRLAEDHRIDVVCSLRKEV